MHGDIFNTGEFYELIRRTGRALRRHAVSIGMALVLLLAVGWLDIAVSVDLLIPLATTFRVVFAAVFWLLVIAGTVGLLLWPVVRRRKLENVALRIEDSVGNMHNRLLTVLDLHLIGPSGKEQSNPEMVAALIRQTHQRLAGFHIRQLIDRMPLVKSLLGLAGVLGVAVLLTLIFRDSALTALARILRPTADIPPLTWLQIAAPGDLAAPAGDPLELAADITRGEVDALSLHLQQPDGQWVVYPMQRDDDKRFSFTLSGVASDYHYKISGGGTWTSQYRIHMVQRPIIDAVATSIRLPAYMRLEQPVPVADDVHRVEAPIDSHIVFDATVSGDATRGEIELLKRSIATDETARDEEHVWFDDDLPADAETERPWNWSTSRAYTGLKSFTFGRAHLPLSFTTRLAQLDVPQSSLFYLMVWLDPANPPQRVTLGLQTQNQTRSYDWGEKSPTVEGQPQPTPVGPLPQPAAWTRLEIPADLLGSAAGPVKLRGLTLQVDHGQALFDRPGYLVRKVTKVENVATEVIDTRAMEVVENPSSTSPDEKPSSHWSGQVHVAADMLVSLRFFSSLGQASADREPLEVVAVQDQSPSIVIEKPAVDVVLPSVEPLPVSARAIDDWGIEAVGIRFGQSENGLGSIRWFDEGAELATSRLVTLAIDPAAEHLAPSQTLWYRLVAKDCKGQLGESKTYKLSIATPDRAGAPETARPPETLEPVRKLLAEMLKAPGKDRESAEFVAKLPEPLRQSLDAEGQFRKPDGSPADADEIRKQLEEAQSQLTPEQKNRLNELVAELDRRQQEMKRLAELLKQAAQKSAASPLTLDQDSKLLSEFAGQAQGMAAELNPPTSTQGEPARLERELKAERMAAGQKEQLAQLARQLAQLEAARQQMASDLHVAQQKLDNLTAQVAAAAAARELGDLATDLETRGRKLQAIGTEAGNLGRQTPSADEKHLTEISRSQTELDRQATGAIGQLRGVLGAPPDDRSQPLALWTPPGQTPASAAASPSAIPSATPAATAQGQTVGQDKSNGSDKTSGQDGKSGSDQGGAPDPSGAAGQAGGEKSWWDKPTGKPSTAGSEHGGEQGADGQNAAGAAQPSTATSEPGKTNPPASTPRGQLTAHQQQLGQNLSASAAEAMKNAASVRELAQRLQEAAGNDHAAGSEQTTGTTGAEQGGTGTPANPQTGTQGGKNESGSDRGGKEKPTGGKPATDHVRGNQPGATQPGQDKPGNDQPGNNQAGGGQNGNTPDQSANNPAGTDDGQPSSNPAEQSQSDAGQLLAAPATQKALAMAERMRAQARLGQGRPQQPSRGQNQPGQPNQLPGQPGGYNLPHEAGAQHGSIAAGKIPGGSDPRTRAQFYQLPPRLRDPLLEGMQERGPEGYQSMIDAYFRELNKEIK